MDPGWVEELKILNPTSAKQINLISLISLKSIRQLPKIFISNFWKMKNELIWNLEQELKNWIIISETQKEAQGIIAFHKMVHELNQFPKKLFTLSVVNFSTSNFIYSTLFLTLGCFNQFIWKKNKYWLMETYIITNWYNCFANPTKKVSIYNTSPRYYELLKKQLTMFIRHIPIKSDH